MHTRTLAELAELLRNGDASSEELTRHFLERIESLDSRLNAFVTVTAEQALIEGNVRRRKRTQKRDAVAAAVMLQSYLDRE